MSGENEWSVEEQEPARWLRRYTRLRWLAVAAALVGLLVARVALHIGVPLPPALGVIVAVALYNTAFALRQQQGGQRWALAQVIADLIALTALLHFAGGIETPLFLFYFVPVAFAGIVLGRRNAYGMAALALGLLTLLVGAEFLGWLPHVHLEGFAPVGLYRQWPYLTAVLVGFAVVLLVLTAGVTTLVAERRRHWKQQVRAREHELEEINRKLAELDRMRVFFLGLASHDLKTPLAAIANYLQTILDGFVGPVNEKQRRWMERANLRVWELIHLINDFLDVAQLAPERIRAEMEPTALDVVMQRALDEVRPRAEEKDITLRVELPERLPLVYAAPRRLQQAIANLLDNAIKCSPRRAEVLLKARQRQDGVRIDVIDAGPVIPVLYLPHVFEDYAQVQRSEFVPGAGLGLSTARKIVEAHGGEIWVESPCSESGKGSCFSFTLPGERRE